MPNIKNIIIFVSIGLALVLMYVFLIKGDGEESTLISNSGAPLSASTTTSTNGSMIGQEFLTILLNVRNIRLDDSIFSNPAFMSLRDSSIVLIPDGNEGRANPFAPIGVDAVPVVPTTTPVTPTTPTPPSTPSTGGSSTN